MKEEYLNVRLERKDVINLIRSTYPPYEDIEMLENLKLGFYSGGFNDKWTWETSTSKGWDNYDINKLFSIYILYKKWKKRNQRMKRLNQKECG